MTYQEKNMSEFRVLDLDEVLAVSGGSGEQEIVVTGTFNKQDAVNNGAVYYAVAGLQGGGSGDSLQEIGEDLVMMGAATAATGALVTQADTPLPGPADVVGIAMIALGLVGVIAGTVAYGTGTVMNGLD